MDTITQIGSDAVAFFVAEIYNGKNKPKTDHRLAVVTFKTDKSKSESEIEEGGKKSANPDYDPNYKKPDARCISVPALRITVGPQVLQDALQQAFEDLQDAVIRKLVVEALDQNKNLISIHETQINFEAVALFAATNAAGGKLTKDGIEEWFDESLADTLTLKLANAMKLSDTPNQQESAKLASAVTQYKGVIISLAAPRAGMSKTVATQLKTVLELCENKDTRMYKALHAKVTTHLTEKEPELMGL